MADPQVKPTFDPNVPISDTPVTAKPAFDPNAPISDSLTASTAPTAPPATIPGTNVPNDYLSKAEDLIGGFTSGAAQNIPFIGKYFKPTPQAQATVVNPDYAKAGQTGGKIYEQVLEQTALAGGAKSILGAAAERYLPWLGKFGGPLSRIAGEAVGAGTSAGLHEQPIGPAAAIGAGGAAASEAASALAPKVAESALRITDRMRGRGRTIGPALLEETSGITPGAVASQAGIQSRKLTSQMEAGVHDATVAGAVGSSQPAHDALDAVIAKTPRNATALLGKLEGLRPSLDLPNYPAGSQYTPDELLELKRGIGAEIDAWPPEWQKLKQVQAAKQQLYGLFDGELDRLVPGNAELNQRISSLIPVRQQAQRLSQGAGVVQRVMGRVGAHTGALAGSLYGGHKYGLPGYVAGAAIPELIGSPTGQLATARLMQLGVPTALARGIVASQEPAPGAAGQFGRTF